MPSLKRTGVGGGEGGESLEKHVPAVFSTQWGLLPTAVSYAEVRNKIHAITKEMIGAKVYIYIYICVYIIYLLQYISICIYVLYIVFYSPALESQKKALSDEIYEASTPLGSARKQSVQVFHCLGLASSMFDAGTTCTLRNAHSSNSKSQLLRPVRTSQQRPRKHSFNKKSRV